jgi:hypothetical protein
MVGMHRPDVLLPSSPRLLTGPPGGRSRGAIAGLLAAAGAALGAAGALLLGACGPAEPAPVAPTPEPLPVATVETPIEREEPGVVRCGVDDRPRPVGAAPGEPAPAAERALLGAPARSLVLAEAVAPMARRMLPSQAPFPPPVDVPRLQVVISPGALRVAGSPAPPSLSSGMTGAADPTVCEELATGDDAGSVELEVRLASTAEPLSVRTARRPPSPFVRCLMERACQIRASGAAASATLTQPIQVSVTEPPPPPPPPRSPSVEVGAEGPGSSGPRDIVDVRLGGRVGAAARSCLTTPPPFDQALKLRVSLTPQRMALLDLAPSERLAPSPELGAPPPPPIESGARMRPPSGPTMRVSQIANEGAVPPEARPFMACVAQRLNNASIGVVPPTLARARTVRFRIVVRAPQ